MKTLPELYELEYLFECDAKLNEPDIPWFYSGASFSLTRDKLKIEFNLDPASSFGEIEIFYNENQILILTLENIEEIKITRDITYEGLTITFDDDNYVEVLEIQTKPNIKTKWGTSLELKR